MQFIRTLLCLSVIALCFAADAHAQQQQNQRAEIKLKSGNTIEGVIVKNAPDQVVVDVNGIQTPLDRDTIESIKFLPSLAEEFAAKRAKLKDEDIDGRYNLAREMYNKRAYDIAYKELLDLRNRAPQNRSVKLLLDIVKTKVEDDTTPPPPDNGNDNNDDGVPNVAPKAGELPTKMLDDKAINKLRVFEISLKKEDRPQITVPRDVLNEFIEKYGEEPAMPTGRDLQRFKSPVNGVAQLEMMFRLQARDFYDKVVVRNDPPVFRDWRKLNRNYVISGCAASNCHGGAAGGDKLFLFTRNPNSEETAYTNFYILNEYATKTAFMIDRQYPERSLLVQYGLPRDQTNTPHPDVEGFRPALTAGKLDREYTALQDWIKKLFRPAPTYNLDYQIPRVKTEETPAGAGGDADKAATETPAGKGG